jgi:uncharacterized protein
MNSIIVSADDSSIKIGARGRDEIVQNIRMILTTIRGTLYLDRNFGLNPNLIDEPQLTAMVKYRDEIINQIEKYEPRVNVVEINFTTNKNDAMNCALTPIVRIEIKNGVLL